MGGEPCPAPATPAERSDGESRYAALEPTVAPPPVGALLGFAPLAHQSDGGTQTGVSQHESTTQIDTPSEQVRSELQAARPAHSVSPWTHRLPKDRVAGADAIPARGRTTQSVSHVPGVPQMNCDTGFDAAAALLSMVMRMGAVHAMAVPAAMPLRAVRREIPLRAPRRRRTFPTSASVV